MVPFSLGGLAKTLDGGGARGSVSLGRVQLALKEAPGARPSPWGDASSLADAENPSAVVRGGNQVNLVAFPKERLGMSV